MINKYFDSSIHIFIDEMNMLLEETEIKERKEYANTKYCEADFAIRLGAPLVIWHDIQCKEPRAKILLSITNTLKLK